MATITSFNYLQVTEFRSQLLKQMATATSSLANSLSANAPAKFEYTYFESLPADSEACHSITPFSTLMNPMYNATSHTLELVVSNF
ncbi:hypothetical protein BGZ65_001656, partial [Modicella reniformis]